MKKKFLILDCFVDEPACLGVPPFISPYPRYIYGALLDSGAGAGDIEYVTIDRLRSSDYLIQGGFDMVFMIGGAAVPGKYLGARIGTLTEARKIISLNSSINFAVGGMMKNMLTGNYSNALLLNHDIDRFAYYFSKGAAEDSPGAPYEHRMWPVLGASVVMLHPGYPNVICEIETSRGCPRETHCSFCSEGLSKVLEYRDEEDILAEIDSLIANGVSRFRIGRQADILQYKPDFTIRRKGFPRPRVDSIRTLFSGLKERRNANLITTLNVDNANPGTIANFPSESGDILKIIAAAVTPGDTLALGFETFDRNVVAGNNLKIDPAEAMEVISMINSIGGARVDGIPVILPGINLIHGLRGETMETFKINYEYLLKIAESGLLIKRINIRKLLPHPGTEIYQNPTSLSRKSEQRFEYYRGKIREDIDHFMLKKIYPSGTVIRDALILEVHGDISYGKQIASYSIAVKHPVRLEMNTFYDSIVIGHRERSLIALPLPIDINSLPSAAIGMIPGIGKKHASEIIINRPFKNREEFIEMLNRNSLKMEESILSNITV